MALRIVDYRNISSLPVASIRLSLYARDIVIRAKPLSNLYYLPRDVNIFKSVELRIKVDLHLGQKVEEKEDFHIIEISFLSIKAISITKTKLKDKPIT